MKNLYFFLFTLFLLTVQTQAQDATDAGIPDAQHVLVVYNSNSSVSESVKNYYRDARNITTDNIVPLPLPESIPITINDTTHIVGLAQETDIIRDFYQDSIESYTPTFHAWRYYLGYVATPIKNWITSHNLTSTIRLILLLL